MLKSPFFRLPPPPPPYFLPHHLLLLLREISISPSGRICTRPAKPIMAFKVCHAGSRVLQCMDWFFRLSQLHSKRVQKSYNISSLKHGKIQDEISVLPNIGLMGDESRIVKGKLYNLCAQFAEL